MSQDDGSLSNADQQRLQQIVQHFRTTWRYVPVAETLTVLQAALPDASDPVYSASAVELLSTDLRMRVSRGETVRVEEYLQVLVDSPLANISDLIPKLLCEEYRLLKQAGQQPDLTLYRRRFPDEFDTLLDLLDESFTSGEQFGSSFASGEQFGSQPPPTAEPRDRNSSTLHVGEGYKLLEQLGRGNYGTVWRAEAPGGVHVALKVISTPIGHELSQSEYRALDIVKQLKHPFLLQLQAFWVADERLVIAMELADGSLKDRHEACIANGQAGIPTDELIRYMRESAEALDYLHDQRRMHRDIKPANILVISGHAKLADFGLARIFGEEQIDATATLGGTPPYMAPEMWHGRAGPRSDQYSLAAAYCELRLGKPVFQGQSVPELMNQHLNENPALAEFEPDERAVLSRALSKRPERRYENCSEFADALADAVLETGPPPRSKARRWLWAALVICLITLGWGAYVWLVPPPILHAPRGVRLAAGTSTRVTIYLDHLPSLRDEEQVEETHENEHAFLSISSSPWADPTANHVLLISADLDAAPGEHTVELVTTVGGRTLSRSLVVMVEPPNVCCPTAFGPAPDAELRKVTADGRIYWTSIVLEQRDVVFRLVEPDTSVSVTTFYISENMVTNRLYAEFAAARSQANQPLQNDNWEAGVLLEPFVNGELQSKPMPAVDYPDNPVFDVPVDDAYAFARWLHPNGHLPTADQWDVAAGRHLPARGSGPYQSWDPDSQQSIAVGRRDLGPLPAGASESDLSPFGCRDMAGNGLEWTSSIHLRPEQRVPLEEPDGFVGVILRGASYSDEQPLSFDDIRDEAEEYFATADDIGFRVVVEVDDPNALECRADW